MKRRETLSALDVLAVARELDRTLKGAFVDKVHQLAPDDVLLKINARGGLGRATLLVLGGRRVHLTRREIEAPATPSPFAMGARKRLANCVIESVEQIAFDRLLKIGLRKGSDTFELVAEILPDGAVALLEEGVIRLVAKTKVFKGRRVATGETYVAPAPGHDPREFDAISLAKAVGPGELVRGLLSRANLGPSLSEEILARTGLAGKTDASSLSRDDWRALAEALHAVIAQVETAPIPAALIEGTEMVDFSPIPLKRWGDGPTRAFATMSELLDAYFEAPADAAARPPEPTAVDEALEVIARLERRRAQQAQVVETLEQEIAHAQGAAEAIYAGYPQVEQLLQAARPGLSQRPLAEALRRAGLEDAAAALESGGRVVALDLKGTDGTVHRVRIALESSVNEIAQSYYKSAARAKEKLAGAREALGDTARELETALRKRDKQVRISRARLAEAAPLLGGRMPPPPKRREWFERFRWFVSSDGNLVVAGRDASTNDLVVKKYLRPGDRYAHADIHGAASVVVKKAEGQEEVPLRTLEEACQFAAIMSRAWSSGVGEASSYWVLPEQVSKTPESGEALGRGAFVIRGKRNTVRHVALQAAVGGFTVRDERKAMCGPVDAVAARCDAWAVIVPGDAKPTDLARQLAVPLQVHIDEIARALPPGGSMIVSLRERAASIAREEE